MFFVSDVLLYDKDSLGLLAIQRHVFWLYSLLAVKFSVDCFPMLLAFRVKLSPPHTQLHTIEGYPKFGKKHCNVTGIPSLTSAVTAVKFGAVDGASN